MLLIIKEGAKGKRVECGLGEGGRRAVRIVKREWNDEESRARRYRRALRHKRSGIGPVKHITRQRGQASEAKHGKTMTRD